MQESRRFHACKGLENKQVGDNAYREFTNARQGTKTPREYLLHLEDLVATIALDDSVPQVTPETLLHKWRTTLWTSIQTGIEQQRYNANGLLAIAHFHALWGLPNLPNTIAALRQLLSILRKYCSEYPSIWNKHLPVSLPGHHRSCASNSRVTSRCPQRRNHRRQPSSAGTPSATSQGAGGRRRVWEGTTARPEKRTGAAEARAAGYTEGAPLRT